MQRPTICFLSVLAYVYSGWLVTLIFVGFVGLEAHKPAGLEEMVSGKAERPYASRLLVPMILRTIPPGPANAALSSPKLLPIISEGTATTHQSTFMVLTAFLFAGFGWAMSRLGRTFYRLTDSQSDIFGIASLLTVPLGIRYFGHVYDPATLFLSAALLLSAARSSWRWFLVLFILACINKETAILVVPVYVLFRAKAVSILHVAGEAVLLVCVYALIRISASLIVAANPGRTVLFHLLDHNAVLFRVAPLSAVYAMVVMAAMSVACGISWRKKDLRLRLGLLVTFIPLFLLTIPFGYIDELRDYFEALPYALLLGLGSFLPGQPSSEDRSWKRNRA